MHNDKDGIMNEEDKTLLTRCGAIATSTWSDALDTLGIAGVVRGIERRAGQGRIAGFAATARQVSGRLGDFERAEFAVGRLVAATGPGRILAIDAGGAAISTFGGIASLAASLRGATGVIIDGACRDVDEIQACGLWLASRCVTPLTGKTRLRLLPLGQPVTIGGIRVHEGDLIVGDDSGLVVVPRGRLQETLAAAQEALKVDEEVERGVRAGMSFADAAAAANYIPAQA
jgi:regulator of RNase E activity RraA